MLLQTYYDYKIPCRFFKFDDIDIKMSSIGFKLMFISNFKANILGKYFYKLQENFPEELRINFSKTLFMRF